MQPALAPAPFPWSEALVSELQNKDFRGAYLADQVRTYIAFQIRALREQAARQWSQTELANRAGTTQSVISRLEDPDYGKLTLQTLIDLAEAFDVALLVQFVEWPDWLTRMANVSPCALHKRSFDASMLMQSAPDPFSQVMEFANWFGNKSRPLSEPGLNRPPAPQRASPPTDGGLNQKPPPSTELFGLAFEGV